MQLNNLDIIILIIVAVSTLIAWSRGLVKEVLSIIGWVLATAAVIYLMPVVTPFANKYIETGWLAGVIAALIILILFLVCWILLTANVVSKIRSSKLSSLDRTLGLFFGVARAALLVILFYILISWIIPVEKQSEVLTQSKYFQLAGKFAAPIEELIPEDTLKIIREKTQAAAADDETGQEEKLEKSEKAAAPVKDSDDLFERLAQPQLKKAKKETVTKIKENFEGYKDSDRGNLDRLIETTVQ